MAKAKKKAARKAAPSRKATPRKAAARKGRAKAPTSRAKRGAPSAKPAKTGAKRTEGVGALFDALIARASKVAAAKGAKLQLEPGLTDAQISAVEKSIRPHFGACAFSAPPSYRSFLRKHGGVYLTGDQFHPDAFAILGPADIRTDTRELVHVPRGVEWETEAGDPCTITTNHLVAFASAGDSEARWCFCTDAPGPDGELPVYYHHQDEPRCAKDVKSGAWINPTAKKPAYRSFPEWLRAYVEAFCEGERLRR
jgi:hypothetical protein